MTSPHPTRPASGRRALFVVLLFSSLIAGVIPPAAAVTEANTFATAPHRNPPPVGNRGISPKPIRIVAMIPSTYPHAAALAAFAKSIRASKWLKAVQTAYPPPANSPANAVTTTLTVTDMPTLTTQSRTVGDYQDYIFQKMLDHGIAKDSSRQTLFLMFIPCTDPHGMDSFGCTSHHPGLDPNRTAPDGSSESVRISVGDSMAVNLGAASLPLDTRTISSSHELAEAYTDTKGLANWNIRTAFKNDPWSDSPPWVRASGTIELADMSEGSQWFETDPVSGEEFAYERIYSTYRTSHGFDDVDVPSGPYAFYNVSTPLGNVPTDWHSGTWPSVPTIPVTAWATNNIGNFTVTASIHTSGGGYNKPCSLPTKSWTVHNGSTFDLHVDTVAVNRPNTHIWCTVRLESVRSSPPAHDDRYHEWFVGLLVTSPN